MNHGCSRRGVLTAGAALSLLAGLGLPARSAAAALAGDRLGAAEPFDFAVLRAMAEELAAQRYTAPEAPAADQVQAIDYDTRWKIAFRPERALMAEGPMPVRLFHLDRLNPLPVRVFVVDGDTAREVLYSAEDFDYRDTGLGQSLPGDLGYSGLRVMKDTEDDGDWLAFQGASYFRSAGQDDQYGLSARGIAVNTALSTAEEFPRFTAFWLEESQGGDHAITIHALLDGPSLTGAYRFEANRAATVIMNVHAELFFRSDIERLGVAPLTSMFWYGENGQHPGFEWRPEVHDSDGLAIRTGTGEELWRPLTNPPSVQVSAFADENPGGFGLMQRDRDFANYLDDASRYHHRPGLWVEPGGAWGKGAVQLVEIPTGDEYHDNIVAYWQPERPAEGGQSLVLDYRLYWQDAIPLPPREIARVVATRLADGPRTEQDIEDKKDVRRMVVEFAGGPLRNMDEEDGVTADFVTSRGELTNLHLSRLQEDGRWRAVFDLGCVGDDPVELRGSLQASGERLTETWIYRYLPRHA